MFVLICHVDDVDDYGEEELQQHKKNVDGYSCPFRLSLIALKCWVTSSLNKILNAMSGTLMRSTQSTRYY